MKPRFKQRARGRRLRSIRRIVASIKGDAQRWWHPEYAASFSRKKEQRGSVVRCVRFHKRALTAREIRFEYEMFVKWADPKTASDFRRQEAHIRKWKREEEKQTAEHQRQVNGCVYASRREAENIKAAIALQDGVYPVPAGTPVHFVLVGGMDVSTARPVTMTIDTSEGETEELTEEGVEVET